MNPLWWLVAGMALSASITALIVSLVELWKESFRG